MAKSRKILLIVLFSILGLLIVAASVLGVYAFSLYNKMTYDPVGTIGGANVEVNDALLRAYDRLNAGEPVDEVLQDPELSPEQIEILRAYYEAYKDELIFDPTQATGTDSPISSIVPPNIQPPSKIEGIINILLLGSDERPGEVRARTDTMVVVSINTQTKEITLTSVLRDTYVEIVGMGRYDKLTSAFQFGGVTMLNDTLKTYFGIQTDNYVHVGFNAFEKVIDELGGVDVPFSDVDAVRREEIQSLRSKSNFSENQLVPGTKGTYHLTGAQALLYCRDRYSGNTVGGIDADWGRTDRQRKVLGALVKKAQSMEFSQLMDMLPKLLELVTTDLTMGDCVDLLSAVATTYKDYTIRNYHIPADSTWNYAYIRNGTVSVIECDFATNARLWRELVYGS